MTPTDEGYSPGLKILIYITIIAVAIVSWYFIIKGLLWISG